MGSTMPRALGAKLALAAGAALAALALAEGGSYLFGTFERPSPLHTRYIQNLAEHDPLLFWRLKANAVSGKGIATNSLGFRGPELGAKAPGELRLLSLGESSTFAKELDYAECYSAVLERLLAEDGRWPKVTVVNAGVPGYTLFQGYQFLVHRALALEPDGVLLYFGRNDFLPVTFLSTRVGAESVELAGRNDWELYEYRARPLQRLRAFLARHSNLYRALAYRESPAQRRARLGHDDAKPRVPEEHRRRLLEGCRAFCAENGLELFVAIPWYADFDDHEPLLRELGAATDLVVIDLPALAAARARRPLGEYFVDRVHPNREGHALIARLLYESLAARGF